MLDKCEECQIRKTEYKCVKICDPCKICRVYRNSLKCVKATRGIRPFRRHIPKLGEKKTKTEIKIIAKTHQINTFFAFHKCGK